MKYTTFLINMDKSVERLTYMAHQLERLGIPFTRQQGIDGKTYDFTTLYDENLSMLRNGSPLSPVERGCALSHRKAIEQFIASGKSYGLILEDDVELPSHFREIIEEVIKDHEAHKTSWEYLSFNYPSVGVKYVRLWLFLFNGKFKREQTIGMYTKLPMYFLKFLGIAVFSLFEGLREYIYKKIHKHGNVVKFYRPLYLAGCYLLTQKGAEKLLAVNPLLVYPADKIQNVAVKEHNLSLFHFCPLVVKQRRDKFKSTMNDLDLSSVMDILN